MSLLEQLVADLGTAWCPDCKRRRGIVGPTHDEPGPPDRHGVCQVYAVTDLDCGHSAEQVIPGATDRVI